MDAVPLIEPHRDYAEERRFGLGTIELGLRYGRTLEPHVPEYGTYDVRGGVRARGLYGNRFGYAFGIGFEVGGIIPSGGDLSMEFMLLGFGIALPRTGLLTVVGGLRPYFSTYYPYALLVFPTEVALEIDLGEHLRVMLRGEVRWCPDGRGAIPGSDGYAVLLALRGGKSGRRYWSNGRYMGVQVEEYRGVPFLNFVLGVHIAMGG